METSVSNFLRPKFNLGLNRTMQYGNTEDEIHKEINKLSLNRTMQYGNPRL